MSYDAKSVESKNWQCIVVYSSITIFIFYFLERITSIHLRNLSANEQKKHFILLHFCPFILKLNLGTWQLLKVERGIVCPYVIIQQRIVAQGQEKASTTHGFVQDQISDAK